MAVKIRAGRKSSAEYWRDREAKQRRQNIKDEKEYVKVVEGIYARCIDNCQREIESFYQRYASKEGISLSEAKKRISKMDIAEYERKAAEYVKTKDFSEQANEEMRLYNATMRINRLELLKSRIGLELCGTYSELEKYLGEKMDERVIATFERYAGILGKTVKDPAALAATIVNASFHNATWSERLWGRSQDGLRDAIGTQLERGMIRGVGSRELARAIRREFDRTVYETERLMVTELARCQTEAAKLSMEANGNTHFIVLTANAAGPCPECIDMELQTGSDPIPVKDMEPGVNAPPLHPSCHCATAPWWDEGKYQEWLDSGAAKAGVPWGEFEEDDILQTGGRETGGHHYLPTPEDDKKDRQAVKAYEKFAREDDSIRIANNTGFDQADIAKIRSHIFSKKHNLYVGYSRFAPDYSMAVAWQRLRNGNYLPRDITLLRHELLEREIEEKYNISISEAHAKASEQYDWWGQVVQEIGEEGEPYGLLQTD